MDSVALKVAITLIIPALGALLGMAVARPTLFKELAVYLKSVFLVTLILCVVFVVGHESKVCDTPTLYESGILGISIPHVFGLLIFTIFGFGVCEGVAALSERDMSQKLEKSKQKLSTKNPTPEKEAANNAAQKPKP